MLAVFRRPVSVLACIRRHRAREYAGPQHLYGLDVSPKSRVACGVHLARSSEQSQRTHLHNFFVVMRVCTALRPRLCESAVQNCPNMSEHFVRHSMDLIRWPSPGKQFAASSAIRGFLSLNMHRRRVHEKSLAARMPWLW